ncbi:MAG: hypothetical protein JNL97_14425 [Verrucomicrobiales bacterium]|nr:hypothetical protein [Verrucomicrobiales bacterium]
MPSLASQLPALALAAVRVQSTLDADWTASVASVRRCFEETGLADHPYGMELEARVRPPRLVVSEFRCSVESDVIRDRESRVGVELRPMSLGFRAAFRIERAAHCRVELELRQVFATPPESNPAAPAPRGA